MALLKNTDITRKYNISFPTILKWIEDSALNKNNLQTEGFNKKLRVIDNLHNEAELSRLANESKKFRSNVGLKKVQISDKFFDLFSDEEVIEIINDIKYKKLFKTKYSYKRADYWDEFYKLRQSPVTIAVDELLEHSVEDLLYLIDKTQKVNLIDIGPGNGFPVKNLLEILENKDLIHKYIAIDISTAINEVSIENIKYWFPSIKVETYERDIESSRFGKIFLQSKPNGINSTNIILHLGNTMCNHEDRLLVLKNIRSGMIDSDLFAFTFTLDNVETRSQLNYIKDSQSHTMQIWPLDLFGIDIDKCEVVIEFDEIRVCRSKSIILDKDYQINYTIFGKNETFELRGGEIINIWRHYLLDLQSLFTQIDQAEMQVMELKLDKSGSYALIICKAKY